MPKLLSKTSKMPGSSFSTSAFACQTGSKLAKIEGSVCNKCYARKGFYHMPNVKAAQEWRLEFMQTAAFVDTMIEEIGDEKYFRWFDAGDVQSVSDCLKIITICLKTPRTKHWCPTKEAKYWSQALEMVDLPKNLIVRLSAPMVGDRISVGWTTHTSSVLPQGASEARMGRVCPAPTQNNTCGDCRACWDKRVTNIVYKEH